MSVTLYQVGGSIRDEFLRIPSKDFDYAVEAGSYEEMRQWLVDRRFTIFVEKPEHLTIRAQSPLPDPILRPHSMTITADFVLCRKDGEYSDGRRPDSVEPGTILDDLARRDFTINAMARRVDDSQLIDPHEGMNDLRNHVLQCVGNTEERLREDSLRALRAIRFRIMLGMDWECELNAAMCSLWLPPLLANVSVERRREELARCFAHNTLATMELLEHDVLREFRDAALAGIRLQPTLKEGQL